MTARRRSGLLLPLAAAWSVASCDATNQPAIEYRYTVPPSTNDGWTTADLSVEHIDSEPITRLLGRIGNGDYRNVHGLLLVRNGRLVLEQYFPGGDVSGMVAPPHEAFTREVRHEQHSVTKSVTSLLIGIAIDQRLIPSVEEKVSSFFPEYPELFADSVKAALRLEHLLSMSAGFSWDEWKYPYTDARNDLIRLHSSAEPIRTVLERPITAHPGSRFVYNGGISLLLGEIIHRVSGQRADSFAQRHLFEPLGITDYNWEKSPSGLVNTGGGLSLRPRDMAKIGQLALNGGDWQGRQIVSGAWIRESTRRQAPIHDRWYAWWVPFFARWVFKRTPLEHNEYGYQWWLGSFRVQGKVANSYRAEGRGGQAIFVFPDRQLVTVFTGWNDNALGNAQPLDMLQRYILPAVR